MNIKKPLGIFATVAKSTIHNLPLNYSLIHVGIYVREKEEEHVLILVLKYVTKENVNPVKKQEQKLIVTVGKVQ